jgi:signal transduction histidine kinase
MEAHKLNLEEMPFDLRDLVEGVADLMAVKSRQKGVELLCFIEPDVPRRLLGDASRLRQVLVNLTGNASSSPQRARSQSR